MSAAIIVIVRRSAPAKVAQVAVGSIAIQMPAFHAVRARTDERSQNKGMNCIRLPVAVALQVNRWVTVAADLYASNQPSFYSPDPALIRDLIQAFPPWDVTPGFGVQCIHQLGASSWSRARSCNSLAQTII